MGPGVPREAQRLVCVCANEFGGAKDRGEYRQAAEITSEVLEWLFGSGLETMPWTIMQ
jgi:hypothetical protein